MKSVNDDAQMIRERRLSTGIGMSLRVLLLVCLLACLLASSYVLGIRRGFAFALSLLAASAPRLLASSGGRRVCNFLRCWRRLLDRLDTLDGVVWMAERSFGTNCSLLGWRLGSLID